MTIKNTWAEPEGVPEDSHPIRYQIRDRQSGKIVERVSELSYDQYTRSTHHALATADQHIANEVSHLIELACRYFWAPDEEYEPLEDVPSIVISDAEVVARINRLDHGENDRETQGTNYRLAERGSSDTVSAYPLSDLPWGQQRALVEQIEKLKAEWSFAWVGVADDMPAGAKNGPSRTFSPWGGMGLGLDDDWASIVFPV